MRPVVASSPVKPVQVDGLAAWMRVAPDRVQRWTPKRGRPKVPYYVEGGRKCFNIPAVERHIREKCFCSVVGVASGYPDPELAACIDYPPGMPLMWLGEFVAWSGQSKAIIGDRVRRGDYPHFAFGGIRLFDPALILEARNNRTQLRLNGTSLLE